MIPLVSIVRSNLRMIFRFRVFALLLVLVSSLSFAQSSQPAPQTSEDKRTKTSATGKPAATPTPKPAKPAAAKPGGQQPAPSVQIDEKLFSGLHWRQVGP